MATINALLRTARSLSASASPFPWVVIEDVKTNKNISDFSIGIYWDLHTCQVPEKCHAGKIAMDISHALRRNHFSGPIVKIAAFGDYDRIPRKTRRELRDYGVEFNSEALGKRDGDRKVDMTMRRCYMYPPPLCHHMLLSGNPDVADAFGELQLRGLDVLLAQPGNPSPPLLPDARAVWQWRILEAGVAHSSELELV